MEWTLEQLVDAQIDYRLAGHYTALLCVVTQVRDLEEAKVDVQPLVNKQYKDGEVQEYPAILSVPVLFPCSSVGGVVFPIVQGDTVLVVFNKSNIDVFKSGATTPHDPIDERSFNIRDAVAIPCVFPFSKTPSKNKLFNYSSGDVILTNSIGEAESEVRLKPNGQCIVKGVHVQIDTPVSIKSSLSVGTGATGSFTTPTGQVVSVSGGIITNIF